MRHSVWVSEDSVLEETLICRAPAFVRFIGGWMFLVAAFIVVGPAVSGDIGGTVFGVFVATGAVLYGLRVLRVAALDRAGCLEIRNRFRTRRVRWEDVLAVDYVERPVPLPMRINMKDRWSARVTCRSGETVYVDATESFNQLVYGRSFSQALGRGRAKADAIVKTWRRYDGS